MHIQRFFRMACCWLKLLLLNYLQRIVCMQVMHIMHVVSSVE